MILRVFFKDKKPPLELEMPEEKAKRAMEEYYNAKPQQDVRLSDFHIYPKVVLGGVNIVKDQKADTWQEEKDKENKEWFEYKKKIKALPPEERWKHDSLDRFKLFYKLYKNKEPSEKVIEVFKFHAIKFFKEHPDFFAVHEKVFLDCFGENLDEFSAKFSGEWKNIVSGFNETGNLMRHNILKHLFNWEIK